MWLKIKGQGRRSEVRGQKSSNQRSRNFGKLLELVFYFLIPLLICALQRRDIELLHLHHSMHDALESGRVPGPLAYLRRYHLPGETVFICEPAALHLFPVARRELYPVIIDLLLRLTVEHERDRFGELELRT